MFGISRYLVYSSANDNDDDDEAPSDPNYTGGETIRSLDLAPWRSLSVEPGYFIDDEGGARRGSEVERCSIDSCHQVTASSSSSSSAWVRFLRCEQRSFRFRRPSGRKTHPPRIYSSTRYARYIEIPSSLAWKIFSRERNNALNSSPFVNHKIIKVFFFFLLLLFTTALIRTNKGMKRVFVQKMRFTCCKKIIKRKSRWIWNQVSQRSKRRWRSATT